MLMGSERDLAALLNPLPCAVGMGSRLARSEIHARDLGLWADLSGFAGGIEGRELGSLGGLQAAWRSSR